MIYADQKSIDVDIFRIINDSNLVYNDAIIINQDSKTNDDCMYTYI
jgi:hypothetical protein